MANVLLILGKETSDFAKGEYNTGLFNAAINTLTSLGHTITTTVVEEGYEPTEEIAKFKAADAVIFQYPVYWFMMPSSLKKYIDNVYAYGEFFGHGGEKYGAGGLMQGKRFMLSTTWNAPVHVFDNSDEFFEGKSASDALAPMRYTQKFCGLEELSHFCAHDVIHNPDFDNHEKALRKHIAQVFSADNFNQSFGAHIMNNDIHLYTAATMNGWKPVIFLEEASIDYDLTFIDFSKKEQKSEWYMKLNPNGRIPTIVDRGNDDFVVFESGAILWYLAEKYGKFLSEEPKIKSETLQWLMFQMGGVGPMMGQAMYFQRIAAPSGHQDDFAITRYVEESRRLLAVLNTRLASSEYLASDEYSIADMATYPWARSYYWAKVDIAELPHLQRWFDAIDARPATQKALTIPKANPEFFGKGDVEAWEKANAARFKSDVKGE